MGRMGAARGRSSINQPFLFLFIVERRGSVIFVRAIFYVNDIIIFPPFYVLTRHGTRWRSNSARKQMLKFHTEKDRKKTANCLSAATIRPTGAYSLRDRLTAHWTSVQRTSTEPLPVNIYIWPNNYLSFLLFGRHLLARLIAPFIFILWAGKNNILLSSFC